MALPRDLPCPPRPSAAAAGRTVAAESAATQACEDLLAVHVHAAAEAQYELGEIHRMRGDLASAEASYRAAHELGRDPRPGLALLRLAQGRTKAALGSISSALVAKGVDRLARARLLAAQVEIAGGAGDLDLARAACEELEQTAAVYGSRGCGQPPATPAVCSSSLPA